MRHPTVREHVHLKAPCLRSNVDRVNADWFDLRAALVGSLRLRCCSHENSRLNDALFLPFP